MNSFIVHPQNKAQEKAVKAFFEAFNVVFEKVDDPIKKEVLPPQTVKTLRKNEQKEVQENLNEEICLLPPQVVEALRKSEEQIKNGEFYTYTEVKQILKKL